MSTSPVPRRPGRRAAVALLALTAALALTAPTPADAGRRRPPERSWIAFTSDRDSPDQADEATINDDIYLLEPRSGRTVRLTTAPSAEQVPVISPDGTRLLFQSTRSTRDFPNPDELWALYSCRLHLDTAHPWCGRAQRVPAWTPLPIPLPFLTWVPGADSILYASSGTIYRLDLRPGATPVVVIARAADALGGASRPSVSRDGRVLAYTYDGDLWRSRVDGSHRVQLTQTPVPVVEGGPEISPDGTRVAFTSNRRSAPSAGFDVWVMDAVPESPTNVPVDLTADLVPPVLPPADPDAGADPAPPSQERYPTWSPDGRQLAFSWYNEDFLGLGAGYNQGEVYRVDADGGRLTNLTHNYRTDLSRYDPAQIGDIQPDWGGTARSRRH